MNRAAISSVLLGALAALAPGAAAQSGGGYELTWSSVDTGGVAQSGGAYGLVASTGQPDAAVATGGAFQQEGGFSPGVCGGTILSYGSGCAGTGGFVPQLSMSGCPATGYDVTLEVTGALGGSSALVFFGLGQAAIPIGGGCLLNVSPVLPVTIGPLPMIGVGPGGGSFSLQATVPDTGAVTVFPLTLQVFVGDPGAPSGTGFSNTNGVQLVFG